MRSKATNLGFSSVEKMFRENYKSLFKQTGLQVNNTNCSDANPGLVPGKFKEFFAWIEAESKTKEFGALLLARAVAPACTLLCISLSCCCQRWESSTASTNRLWQKPETATPVRACSGLCHPTHEDKSSLKPAPEHSALGFYCSHLNCSQTARVSRELM